MPAHDPRYREAVRTMRQLMAAARRRGLNEPTAATLATADPRGRPSARTVLIKGVDERGVLFFTNLRSRKGRQLAANPHAALCAFWDPLMRQLLIEGAVEPVSDEEADAYWATRDRSSQLGAWASQQSSPLPGRAALLKAVAAMAMKFRGRPVPRPPHWSGYRLVPNRIELWTARPFRLNERLLYERRDNRWHRGWLYP